MLSNAASSKLSSSYLFRRLYQTSVLKPNARVRRAAISNEIPRCPRQMSFTLDWVTPMWAASADGGRPATATAAQAKRFLGYTAYFTPTNLRRNYCPQGEGNRSGATMGEGERSMVNAIANCSKTVVLPRLSAQAVFRARAVSSAAH